MIEGKGISPAFAETIENQRDALNSLYRQVAGANARIRAEAFSEHLVSVIGPIVDAVNEHFPERVRATTFELFRVSLELFNNGLLGDEPKVPEMLNLWSKLFPAIAKPIARDPRRVVGGLCNALLQIDRMQRAGISKWTKILCAAGPKIQNVEQLFDVGIVASWVSGMAVYRLPAIEKAIGLPNELRDIIFDNIVSGTGACPSDMLHQWREHPWTVCRTIESADAGSVEHVATCGAFRGLGGLFIQPPHVFSIDKNFFVSDGTQQWQMVADQFGCVFVPSEVPEPQKMQTGSRKQLSGTKDDSRRWKDALNQFPTLAEATSVAMNESTIAVTIPTSFHVFLFAVPLSPQHG